MIPYIGDFRLSDTIEHWFPSHSAAGGSITIGTNGTFRVFRDGTLLATGPSIVFDEDKNGYTGVHRIELVLTGADVLPFAEYAVVYQGAVVDGQTLNVPLFTFSIMNRGTEVMQRTTLAAVTADGGTLTAYAKTNVGDYVMTVPTDGTRPDMGIIDTFNAGTGEFVLRDDWRTVPAVGSYVQVIASPAGGIIGPTDIADNAFQSSKFADGFLTAAKIGANAITEEKIADNAITAAQLAANAITNLTLAADAIQSTHLHATVLDEIASKAAMDALVLQVEAARASLQSDVGAVAASTLVGMWAKDVSSTMNFEEVMKVLIAVLAGKSNGLTLIGGTAHFRDVEDTKDVVTMVLDATGNRLSTVLNP